MPAPDGPQFEHIYREPDMGREGRHEHMYDHAVLARGETDKGPAIIGQMLWRKGTGEITKIHVNESHRRQGVATSMYRHALSLDVDPPVHNTKRTDAGDAWAQAVGGDVPPRDPNFK